MVGLTLLMAGEAHHPISKALAVAVFALVSCDLRDRSSSVWPAIVLLITYNVFARSS